MTDKRNLITKYVTKHHPSVTVIRRRKYKSAHHSVLWLYIKSAEMLRQFWIYCAKTWPWNAKTLSFRLYNRPISVSFHRVYSYIHITQFDFINLSQLTFSFSVWTRIGSLGDFQFRLKTNAILVKVLNCSFSRISSTVSFLYWQGGSGP